MEKPQAKRKTGSKTATDEEIRELVAEVLLMKAIKKRMAKASASNNNKPSPTSAGKKPSE